MKLPIFYLLKKPAFHIYRDSELLEISFWYFNLIIVK